MKALIFGATGMVGQGVLREALMAPDVTLVQTVGRMATGTRHPKLRELVHADLLDYRSVEDRLRGFDACSSASGRRRQAWTRHGTRGSTTTSRSPPRGCSHA